MDPTIADKIVSNKLYELLDESNKGRFAHLQIADSDDSYLKQSKVLSTEILLLRSQVKDKMVEKSGGSGNSNNSRVPAIGLTAGVSWRDTVAPPSEESPRMRLEFFSPVIDGDKVRVSTPNQVEELGMEKWQDCVVGHFVDKKLPYMTVRSIAFNKWAKFGLSDVLSNDKGFYFFQFGVSGAYRQIVEAGPWHFGGRWCCNNGVLI